jgi:hypothetical protein
MSAISFVENVPNGPPTLGLSGLKTAQIRFTATSRYSNFLTGFTPGSPL